ncbi:MAG: hypothetical protein GY796_24280 [Chloroflexi bacterium]|nr:hypothetical protein [Chloroflexota bacterium]
MKELKRYLPSFLVGLWAILASPIFLFIIFLSGDSCCGENTSGTMIIVTAVILTIHLILSLMINLFIKTFFMKDIPEFSLIIGTIITFLPSLLLYVICVTFIILTAFVTTQL